MARPLPINLAMVGVGGILLVSGFGGKSIGEVLKGSFGNLKVNPKVGSKNEGEPSRQPGANLEQSAFQSGGELESGAIPPGFAPSPQSLSPQHRPLDQKETERLNQLITSGKVHLLPGRISKVVKGEQSLRQLEEEIAHEQPLRPISA